MMYRIKIAKHCKFGSMIRTELVVDGPKVLREDITMYTPKSDMPEAAVEDYSWLNTGGKFNLKSVL